jgi:hypothetical protein
VRHLRLTARKRYYDGDVLIENSCAVGGREDALELSELLFDFLPNETLEHLRHRFMCRKVYVMVCVDRHIDPIIEVFTDVGMACKRCKEVIEELAAYPEDIEEFNTPKYMIHYKYSPEMDDYAFVEEVNLSQEVSGDE